MTSWFSWAAPGLRLLDAESAHRLAIWVLARGLAPRSDRADDPMLHQTLWGRVFANPVGIAAGFDKHAEAIDGLLDQGFGFVEIGSVTPEAQPGNPRPRVFRLPADEAVINRYGFNSEGVEAVRTRLAARAARARRRPGLIGVNLGKNKDSPDAAADYVRGAVALAPFADYLVVNVSSPNTPGLRDLQGKARLDALIAAVQAALAGLAPAARPPLLLKIAPDLTEGDVDDIVAVATARAIAGLIVSNTTLARPASLNDRRRGEAGGLSGKPLFAPSTRLLAAIYRKSRGALPLIGVGGIASPADAYAKIRAGASLVQLYTALVFQGPALIARIRRELPALLRADGFASIAEAVGADQRI